MKTVDVKAVRTVFNNYFRIVEAEVRYQLANGQMSSLVRRLSFERGDSAAAVVVNEHDSVVIVTRQFRFPTVHKGPGWTLELVAGTVDKGETPEACIRREIGEELGYEALTLHPISTFYTSPGGSSEQIHLFHATVATQSRVGPGGGLAAENEDIELLEIPLADLPARLESGEIVDAKTIIGLTWLAGRCGYGGRFLRHEWD